MAGERIRTTISIDPDVFEVFKTMAEAGGTSVSRCMGDWLADTVDGAQFVAQKMQEARKAPMNVMREFQAMSVGFQEEVNTLTESFRADRVATGTRSAPGGVVRAGKAPSSNTGLKSPPPLAKSKGKKS